MEPLFDDSIYESIANRFGNNPPPGGVIFETPHFIENGSHWIDSYGRGCVHDSIHNPFKKELISQGHWNRPQPFPADNKKLKSAVKYASDRNITVHLGLKSDCFMWIDRKYKVTQYLLELLNNYKVNYVIHTRSDLVAHDDYLQLLDREFATIIMYLPTINQSDSRIDEPGAPSVKRRVAAYKKLKQNSFNSNLETIKKWGV